MSATSTLGPGISVKEDTIMARRYEPEHVEQVERDTVLVLIDGELVDIGEVEEDDTEAERQR